MPYTKFRWFFLFIILPGFYCTPDFSKYKSQYRFTDTAQAPDYSRLQYWAAHPWKKDLSDSVPAALKDEERDSAADVFFIHPTTYTEPKAGVNAGVNDAELNAKTDYSAILYQSSVFNQHARVFAPRYRQAHLSQFFVSAEESQAAFDTGYADVKRAFEFYLEKYHQGRPVIIAGHSQGALLGERLLKDYFDGKPLGQKLVAAYIVGWPVAKNYFSTIPVCSSPEQTGCVCSWRTFRKNYVPAYIQNESPPALVTNPLSWTTTNDYYGREQNKGSVLRNFNETVYGTSDAQVHDGVLWINKPKFRGSFFFRTKNYHIADINLFYMNIRENAAQRIASYLKK